MNNKEENRPPSKLRQILMVSIPLLVMVLGFEVAGMWFDGKSTALSQDGVVATAVVYNVTRDALGEGLTILSDTKQGLSSNRRSKIEHWKLHYRYFTEDGAEFGGSYNVQAYEQPSTGLELEVRYSKHDPSIHETAIGHTESQGAALHWIALIFGVIWLVALIWMVAQLFFSPKMTTREKRLQRMAQLEQNDRP